jgi:hypothetical protein
MFNRCSTDVQTQKNPVGYFSVPFRYQMRTHSEGNTTANITIYETDMKSIFNLFKPTSLETKQMTPASPETESTPLEEPAPLAKSTKAAQDFFRNRPHIDQAVVIEQIEKTEADVSIFDRALGKRITVRVPVTDRMEADALELATRFSNARTEAVRC